MLYQLHPAWVGFELTTLVVIGTDCIGSCLSNHITITTTMAPVRSLVCREEVLMIPWKRKFLLVYINEHDSHSL